MKKQTITILFDKCFNRNKQKVQWESQWLTKPSLEIKEGFLEKTFELRSENEGKGEERRGNSTAEISR